MGARTRSFILSLAAVLIGVANARADEVEDRVRLTLDTAPLAIVNTTVRGVVDLDLDGISGEQEYENDQLTVGVAPSFGASLGYGVGSQFLVGLRLTLTSTTTEQEMLGVSTASTTIMALPYVTFVGGDESASVRFTATLMAGLATSRVRAGGGDARSASGGAMGAAIGFLGFAAERFSIDPALFVLYEAGSGDVGEDATYPSDFDYTGTTIGALVSFSGWIGKDKERPFERPMQPQWASAPPAPREVPVAAPARPETKLAVLSTRTTLDSAIFMLLGAPEQRGSEVALRIQRYAPAGEATCESLQVELDGTVASTLSLKQSVRDDHGVQETTVQGSIDVELADRMAKARVAKLRWCGNERTLSLAARDGISRFIASMRARLENLPPLEAPAPPPEETPTPAAPPEPAATPAPAATP